MDEISTQKIVELERRLDAVEAKVAVLSQSPPAPPEPPTMPSFKDISLPIPSVESLVNTAKTTWTLIAMFNELKMLFWTLFDRRYHMAWLTRLVITFILVAILLSHWWLPFAFDNVIGRLWEKVINLLLGFVMFFILHFEMRRYQEWLGKRA